MRELKRGQTDIETGRQISEKAGKKKEKKKTRRKKGKKVDK